MLAVQLRTFGSPLGLGKGLLDAGGTAVDKDNNLVLRKSGL